MESTKYAVPRDELELRLTHLWEETFDQRPIGIRDDYFELGGDSLMATVLLDQIEQQFGLSMSLGVLFERPTIERLAELLRGSPQDRLASTLLVLQVGETRPPLFCVPGIHGSLWEFRKLAQHLGPELPVYGLQPVGLDGLQTPHRRIEDMAEHYVEKMRQVQPVGPYYLTGYSLGGPVAYEMSQQLHAAGETVALLALLDAPTKGYPKSLRWTQQMLNRFGFASPWSKSKSTSPKSTTQNGEAGHADPHGESDPFPPGRLQVFETHMRALTDYKVQTYPARVTVFRAMVRPTWPKRLVDEDSEAWIRLAKQGGEVLLVPGDHDQMFQDGHIEVLAEKLNQCLEKAQRPSLETADR